MGNKDTQSMLGFTPDTAVQRARSYLERIALAISNLYNFMPLMTLYVAGNTSIGKFRRANESGF